MLLHIYNSNLIENIDDPEADAQSCEAWAYLLQQKELTPDIICKLQKMITLSQADLMPNERGYYRDMAKVNVYMSGSVPPLYHMVKPLMDNWLLDYKELPPLAAHIRFEKIHPFVDGNGRTGRMLMWWQERQAGLEPTLIKYEERDKYYELFK